MIIHVNAVLRAFGVSSDAVTSTCVEIASLSHGWPQVSCSECPGSEGVSQTSSNENID